MHHKKHHILFLALYFLIVFFALLDINLIYMDGIPHVPDSVAYLFMARQFASGHIITTIPIPSDFVNFFPEILSVNNGTWLFQYPFGHPLLLALGVLLGFPNIIPPLVGAASIIFLFLIARNIYGERTAFFLLPLPLLSPFFLENAASFMSHNTAFFYLVVSLFFLIRYTQKGKLFPLLISAIFIGLLFNTRPLTTLPFLIIESSIILLQKKYPKKNIGIFLACFAILFLMYLGYNAATNGSATHFQYYSQNHDLFESNLFNLSLYFQDRWGNFIVLFNNLGPMIYNVPPIIVYSIILIPFIFFKSKFWDKIFLISIFSLPFVYFFYNGRFLMYGPRFWYEIMPFIFLLTARSLSLLAEKKFKTVIFIYALCAGISLSVLFGLTPSTDPDIMSPLKLTELKGFNYTNNGIYQTLTKNNISKGVIFVADCQGGWWCYGSVFAKNLPSLNTDLVYLKDLGDYNDLALKRYYPNKVFYKIDYYTHQLNTLAN